MENIKDTMLIDKILNSCPNPQRSDLGGLLYKAQLEFGYLNEAIIRRISRYVGVSATEAYGYASFYSMYNLEKPGKYIIKICKGTPCHIKDGDRLVNDLIQFLGIADGETSEDGLFTLELTSCLGLCALSPVVMINDKTYTRVKFAQLKDIISDIRQLESGGAG